MIAKYTFEIDTELQKRMVAKEFDKWLRTDLGRQLGHEIADRLTLTPMQPIDDEDARWLLERRRQRYENKVVVLTIEQWQALEEEIYNVYQRNNASEMRQMLRAIVKEIESDLPPATTTEKK